MKWVVTGGLGFIGSHFVELLFKKRQEVEVVDSFTYASNDPANIKGLNIMHIKRKDINDLVASDLRGRDVVVNFAGETHVDNSIEAPRKFVQSNVVGVLNILEVLRSLPKGERPLMVQISTDEVFGDVLGEAYPSVYDPLDPRNPYSASKAGAEHIVKAYHETYGVDFVIIRLTNNYGTRQYKEKLIPSIISRVVAGKPVLVHGSGEQIRNWLHVEDAVRWVYEFSTGSVINTVYHVASDDFLSVNGVVEIVGGVLESEGFKVEVEHVADRSCQDMAYALDPDNELPKRSFGKEVKKIVKHYLSSEV